MDHCGLLVCGRGCHNEPLIDAVDDCSNAALVTLDGARDSSLKGLSDFNSIVCGLFVVGGR